MQQSLPNRVCTLAPDESPSTRPPNMVVVDDAPRGQVVKSVTDVISENSVIVFGTRGCCMCHVMKRLLITLGVNPAVYDVDEKDEVGVIKELAKNNDSGGQGGKGDRLQLPLMYTGGKLFGGLDRLMTAHISGDLVPILIQAGALWL